MSDAAANEGRQGKSSRSATENRVDPAHRVGPAPAESNQRPIPAAALAAAMAGNGLGEAYGPTLLAAGEDPNAQITWSESGVALVSQIREQATQLARHLQSQQQHLDRREAELHAREASLESEVRSARLWLMARQSELEDQASAIAQQAAEVVEAEALGDEPAGEAPTLRLHIDEEAEEAIADHRQHKELENRSKALDARLKEVERREVKLAETKQLQDKRMQELMELERTQQTIGEDLQRRETLLAQQQGKLTAQKTELEGRHRQIDERQAQLYRDIEEHTQQRARLGSDQHALEELRADIAERRSEFEQQRLVIERQRSECEAVRAETAAQLELERALERDLVEREQALAMRQREIETAIKRFERLGIVEERVAEMDELAKQFQQRRRYLDDAETLLEQQEAELQANRERLEAERLEHEGHVERERTKALDEQKRTAAELTRQRESLQRRTEHLDSREAALEQLRAEVNRGQRESLETRLATEELWAQMAGPLAPASLARSLAQVRAKLAEHYRMTDRELSDRRQELETLRRALDEKHTQLQQRWHELEDWAERQRHDVEEQAARLVGREQELDRQQSYFDELESRWEEERHGYRQDIRLLLSKLRTFAPEVPPHLSTGVPHAAVA